MPTPISLSVTFGTLSGNVAMSNLDTDFAQIVNAMNGLIQYSTYAADTGVVNAYVLTYGAPLSVAYADGLWLLWSPSITNTGAATININSLGAKAITNPDGSALSAGQLVAGQISIIVYKGTGFQIYVASGTAKYTDATANFTGNLQVVGKYLNYFSAFKPGSTDRSNTATYADDPDLVLSSVPSGTYEVECLLLFSGLVSGSQGIKWRLLFPGTIPFGRSVSSSVLNSVGSVDVSSGLSAGALSTFTVATISTLGNDYTRISGTVQLGTTQNVSVQWAQNTLSANVTRMLDMSRLTLRRIA